MVAKFCFCSKKMCLHVQCGINAMARPQIISSDPTTLRYHLLGTLKSSVLASGKTFAYLTYSFRCNIQVPRACQANFVSDETNIGCAPTGQLTGSTVAMDHRNKTDLTAQLCFSTMHYFSLSDIDFFRP